MRIRNSLALILLGAVVSMVGCPKPDYKCDFNDDGNVDTLDLNAQGEYFQKQNDTYDVTGDGWVLGDDTAICLRESAQ